MKFKAQSFLLFMFVLLAITSCSNNTLEPEGTWSIYSFSIEGKSQQLAVSNITFEKISEDSYSINGNSGVNSYFGNISVKGTKLQTTSNFGSTKMAGSLDDMQFENNFLKCLTGATNARTYEENGNQLLEITNANEKSVLTFVR